MVIYNETRIRQGVADLQLASRTAFAAACAERLWPLVERYAEAVAISRSQIGGLRESLNVVWEATSRDAAEIDQAQAFAEMMVPDEDDDWVLESGYAQSAIAAIAYAARTWLGGDPQDAVWAARQVFEAAHYGDDHREVDADESHAGSVSAPVARDLVGVAVSVIDEDLNSAQAEDIRSFRQKVTGQSSEFARLFP